MIFASIDVGRRFRTALRLIAGVRSVEFVPVPQYNESLSRYTVNIGVRRFEESIAGRAYLFEVASVEIDRWRACIVKAPGVRTALMPFYGHTADEAAESLRQWLTRAHARAAQSPRRA